MKIPKPLDLLILFVPAACLVSCGEVVNPRNTECEGLGYYENCSQHSQRQPAPQDYLKISLGPLAEEIVQGDIITISGDIFFNDILKESIDSVTVEMCGGIYRRNIEFVSMSSEEFEVDGPTTSIGQAMRYSFSEIHEISIHQPEGIYEYSSIMWSGGEIYEKTFAYQHFKVNSRCNLARYGGPDDSQEKICHRFGI